MPFKSEKQRRYLWANEPEIAREWTDRYGARGGGIMSWADQGGMKNYLGEQEMVNAPKKWRSKPDSPPTELAYITQPEKELIIRSNIHGSLSNGPNEGPSGIMSLDDQGDYTRDLSPAGRQSSPGGPDRSRVAQDRHEDHMRSILTGQKDIGQTVQTGPRTRQYSDLPEWMEVKVGEDPGGDPIYKRKHMASAYKSYGQPSFLGNLFSRGAPGYRGIKGLPAWGDPMKNYSLRDGPKGKAYYTDKENFGEMRDAFPAFGIMGIIRALANKFKKPPRDMSEFNKLSLTKPENQKVYLPGGSQPMASRNLWTKPISSMEWDQSQEDLPAVGQLAYEKLMNINNIKKMLSNPVDNSMYGGDKPIFRNQNSTDFNIDLGPDGITYYHDEDNINKYPNSVGPRPINQPRVVKEDYYP